MKVLEEPKQPIIRTYTFRCRSERCQALLQAQETEGKLHYDQRDGNAIEFHCPRCGHASWIDVNCYDRTRMP